MKKKLTAKETITVASMLFGMFFGAGNLIFPVYMGQAAGYNVWPAIFGFLITGVGFPLLAVAALGISKSSGLLELSSKVSNGYGMFFTCLLYLTIGPFFAIPRCASVPFTVSVQPLLGENVAQTVPLAIFSGIFFIAVLLFSLKPNSILTWIGKILNPLFLIFLMILVITSFISPMGKISDITPDAAYAAGKTGALFRGFLEGYNTMDALAGLAFGIVVVNVIKGLGIKDPQHIASNTVYAGIFSCLIMAAIYIAVTIMGTQSRGAYPLFANGGEGLWAISKHYFGNAGGLILAITVTFACLKTSVGLITSCGETFKEMFPKGPSYRFWAILFCVVSFLIANIGLTAIISYSLPVLMFLYPLAITLILLSLFSSLLGHRKEIYISVTAFTLVAALVDFAAALPEYVTEKLYLTAIISALEKILPFYNLGLGWVCPAVAGLIVGIVVMLFRNAKKSANE